MNALTGWIAGVVLMAAVAGQAAPSLKAVRATVAPVMDGALDDACWAAAQPVSGFVVLGEAALAKEQTEVRVLYDDRALYLAITCHESQMEKLVALRTSYGPEVCGEDCVEVFLDPNHDKFNYFHFALNALGTQFDASGDGVGVAADWNAVWEAKTARGTDCWTAEVAIPFAALGISGKVGSTWGLNVCRNARPGNELSCWSQTGAKFAVPAAFGEMTGLEADWAPYLLTLGVTDWGTAIIGGNAAQVKVTNDGARERDLVLRLTMTPPVGEARTAEVAVGVVPPKVSRSATLPYEMLEAGEHRIAVEALDAAAGRVVCAATGRRVSVAPPAEFSVFKSFYRDDVAVRYQVNVQAAELARYALQATLAGADGQTIAQRKLERLEAPAGELRFDTGALAAGLYTVRMRVVGAGGRQVAAETLSFPMLRREVGQRHVDVDAQNFLRVEGQRVFPVGLYATPGSEKGLEELAAAGYTLVAAGALPPAPMKGLLDKAQRCGLKVWIVLSSLLDFSKDAETKRQQLTELVAAVGDHPALLMWESIDEPAWGSQNAEGLYEGYQFMRALDQHHPIWTNHAPRNLISTLGHFNRATDIAGCDIYPVPEPQSQSNLPNRTIHVVGDEADKSVASVNGDKPIIMVLQGFGWAELGGKRGAASGAILPTFEESRFMAYDAILHGARGINYWGTAYTERPSLFYSELKTLVTELKDMTPVLVADGVRGPEAARVSSADDAVQISHRRLNGKTYVIAINTLKQDRQARIEVPGLTAATVRVLYEGGELAVLEGAWEDSFAPYGVHIYTDDREFDPQHKDFTAEITRRPAQTGQMNEPGNLLSNPSFEVDADDDECPDGWTASYPFTMSASERQAHAGKRSLELVSGGADFGPLAVHYGIPGQTATGKYRLSSWVKTDRPGLEFRIYVEWAGWHGAVLPWTKGTGEWQYVEIPFDSEASAVGTSYAVVQIKGEGRGWFDEVAIRER